MGTALTSDYEEVVIADVIRDCKKVIYLKHPHIRGQLEYRDAVVLQPVTQMPAALFQAMTQDPLSEYWVHLSGFGNVTVAVRNHNNSAIGIFVATWSD